MARTTNDAMQRIDPILNDGWWMSLTSPWRNGDYWFCGLTPKGATGWNGRPDIEASGETAPEAIENCCKKWEEWRERIAPAAGEQEPPRAAEGRQAETLGHSSIAITSKYTHVRPGESSGDFLEVG